jgi:hypothetical protein
MANVDDFMEWWASVLAYVPSFWVGVQGRGLSWNLRGYLFW